MGIKDYESKIFTYGWRVCELSRKKRGTKSVNSLRSLPWRGGGNSARGMGIRRKLPFLLPNKHVAIVAVP